MSLREALEDYAKRLESDTLVSMPKRLYATAEEARAALDDEGISHPHAYLGGICDEAECYCGVQMPLDDNGKPRLTFEEWIDYHDTVLMDTLDADERAYAEEAELVRAIAAEEDES